MLQIINMHEFIADAKYIVGSVTNDVLPPSYQPISGVMLLLSNILRLVFVAAGIFAFINLIIAGFQFMTAGGDSKAIASAWNRIWQSLVGLIIIIGSFALAALFGYIIFGDATFILKPQIYGPK